MVADKEYTGRATIRMYNADCMDLMSSGKTWDLAIVDPPYGIGMDGGKIGMGKNQKKKSWDVNIPEAKYFERVFNVSDNQIIWGANYMTIYLPASSGWIYWDKLQNKEGHRYGKTFASGELAFTSLKRPMQHFEYKYQGNYMGSPKNITTKSSNPKELKIHPTQKPTALYKWLLTNYANEGDTILDTHGGSMSIAIACWDLGFDLDICELDTDYFNDAVKRFEQHISQTQLF